MNPILLCGKIFVISYVVVYILIFKNAFKSIERKVCIKFAKPINNITCFWAASFTIPQIRVSYLRQVWKSRTDVQNMVDTLISYKYVDLFIFIKQ